MANYEIDGGHHGPEMWIDVVSIYRCKSCNFSSPNALTIRTHVTESHLNSTAPNKVDLFAASDSHYKSIGCIDLNVSVLKSENSDISGGDKTIKLNFICNSCTASFSSSNIVQHMVNFHGVQCDSLSGPADCSETGAELVTGGLVTFSSGPKNVSSVGTQVEILKQRGRKRKIVNAEPSIEDADSRDDNETAAKNQDSLDCDDAPVKQESIEASATKTRMSRMLKISRLMEDVSNCFDLPKRQVRPPKTLVDDYHIVHQRHWKRSTTTSSTENKFRCGLEGCGALFSSEKGIEYHVSCHVMDGDSPGSQFCCPECSSTFTTWIDVRVHLLESHNIVIDRFTCNSCDFCAETASLLEEHNIAVHAMETTADDEYTPRVSTGVKRPRKPRQSAPVEVSESTNAEPESEETECLECQRKFADQKSMKRHIEIVHEKVKRFMCSLCGHSTAYKSLLQQHMRKHTGEKPYREKSLKRHLESKHPDAAATPAADDGSVAATPPKVPRSKKRSSEKGAGRAEKLKAAKLVPTVFACHSCRYQTVNKRSYLTHMATHGEVQQVPDGPSPVMGEPEAQLTTSTEVCSVLSSLADAASSLQVCAAV